jgi:hypothetical protein
MATRYSSRYLGIMSLQRFLAVERYYECQRPVSSRRASGPAGRASAERSGAERTSAKVR